MKNMETINTISKYSKLYLEAAKSRKEYMREYMKSQYHNKRNAIIDFLGGECLRCKSKKGPFHLDHKNKRKKTMRSSDLHSVNKHKFKEEIKNIQLLCEKCHKEKTKESWDYSVPKPRHGTHWMYRKYKCRCKKCIKAYKEKQKEWRKNRQNIIETKNEILKYLTSEYLFELKKLYKKANSDINDARRLHDPDRYATDMSKLKSYLNKGYFLHFTKDPSTAIGVNVKTEWNTPAGIYGYPLTDEFFNSRIPFRSELPWIVIFKPKGNYLKVSEYTESDLQEDLNKLEVKTPINEIDSHLNHPASKLFNIVYNLNGGFDNPNIFGVTNAFKRLGYTGVDDDLGLGIIHRNERLQAVFFSEGYIEPVDIIKNWSQDDSFPKEETGEELRNRSKILEIANNINTAPEKLAELAKSKYEHIQKAIANNENIPPEALAELAKSKNEDVQEIVARNPNTPPEVLVELVKSKNKDVQEIVANKPNTPPEVLVELVKSKNKDVQRAAANNPNIPTEVLAILAKSENQYAQQAVAKNRNTPSEVLAILAKSEDKYVQKNVANNPNTPPEVLVILAKSEDKHVQETVANNPNTPPEVLVELAKSENEWVQYYVVNNPNTPSKALAILAKSEYELVQKAVANNPNTPSEALAILAKSEYTDIQKAVANNPNTPPEVLAILAKSENEYVQEIVAKKPNTPSEVLAILAKSEDKYVQKNVANNPNTPPEVLAILAKSEYKYVQNYVVNNPNTPSEALAILAKSKFEDIKNIALQIIENNKKANINNIYKDLLFLKINNPDIYKYAISNIKSKISSGKKYKGYEPNVLNKIIYYLELINYIKLTG